MHDPKFQFTTIQYNKNMRAARHVDGRNVGTSYIIGLGNYTGGELIIYDKAYDVVSTPNRYIYNTRGLEDISTNLITCSLIFRRLTK